MPVGTVVAGDTLSMEEAVTIAIHQDPWLQGSRYREKALINEAASAATLPDPRVSLAAANFPADTFNLDQEAMTQVAVGVSQMFPRGDTLKLAGRQKRELAAEEPYLRQDRKARVTAMVKQLWLEALQYQESIQLIQKDRFLFEYLVDATRTSYTSALKQARQQDIIRSQLELTRLDDRLTMLHQQYESARQRLSEWVGDEALLALEPPAAEVGIAAMAGSAGDLWAREMILQHPLLLALDQRINAMDTSVDLARQKYRPEWGINAQYGYRDDDPAGRDRADLVSLAVSFDLPLFTANRQDREVAAAISRLESLKTERQLKVRQLLAELNTARVKLERLGERFALYEQTLLPQMAELAEAALAAYNNDTGDFSEAVRARIAELNTKIDFLEIRISRQTIIAQLDYLTASAIGDNLKEVIQ